MIIAVRIITFIGLHLNREFHPNCENINTIFAENRHYFTAQAVHCAATSLNQVYRNTVESYHSTILSQRRIAE